MPSLSFGFAFLSQVCWGELRDRFPAQGPPPGAGPSRPSCCFSLHSSGRQHSWTRPALEAKAPSRAGSPAQPCFPASVTPSPALPLPSPEDAPTFRRAVILPLSPRVQPRRARPPSGGEPRVEPRSVAACRQPGLGSRPACPPLGHVLDGPSDAVRSLGGPASSRKQGSAGTALEACFPGWKETVIALVGASLLPVRVQGLPLLGHAMT